MDPQILNKLRFALPTVGIAKAFNPSAVDLPEKQYRDIKVKMLRWSFCRALIISPPCLVNKLRGTAAQAEIFLHAVKPVKHLFISRKLAAQELRRATGEEVEKEETIEPPSKRFRYEVLEEKMHEMFNTLMEKFDKVKENRCVSERDWDFSEDDGESEDDHDSISGIHSTGSARTPPKIEESPIESANDLEALSMDPQVKEREPVIPPPSADIKVHRISCQKLGSSSWNKIRYKEVQKKLHASSVFDTLKVNSQLENVVNKSYYQILLERMDELAGTISHGLLKPREYLKEGLKTLASKHPEAYNSIKEVFVGNSPFKEVSDDLLQFTCARRAEVFEMRRKVFKPKDQHHAEKLAEIPPSESHLFDEELLSKFLDQQGGVNKVFPIFRQQFKEKPFYGNRNKLPEVSWSEEYVFKEICSSIYI